MAQLLWMFQVEGIGLVKDGVKLNGTVYIIILYYKNIVLDAYYP